MWVPALASVVARLVLREGFSDVSFRWGGRRGWSAIVVALLFPIVVGLIAYGIAWMTTLARFAPRSDIVGDTASPLTAFVVHAAWNSTIVGAFDSATTGAGAALWVGESGILTAFTLVVAAFLFSRGRWTIRRQPEARRSYHTPSSA